MTASADMLGEEGIKANVVCENCQKSVSPIPEKSLASNGQRCEVSFAAVNDCMKEYGGQISSCTKQWEAFRQCHDDKDKK
jgi:hypothetical protein